MVADLKGLERRTPSLGLLRSARPALLAALACDLNRPLLVVVGGVERATALVESLRAWLPTPERVLRLPEPLPNFYERAPWSRQVVSGRLRVLTALSAESLSLASAPPIIVASARALMQPTLPRRQFRLGTRPMRPGQL
ncbi:MAG: hypothetical protein GY824_23185, partial [Delftia sp.]|nr:hypothetical protein [Delftia sp.]